MFANGPIGQIVQLRDDALWVTASAMGWDMRSYQSIEHETARKNLRFLMGLRTAAFCAQLATVFYCYYGLSIVLPVAAMVLVASLMVVFNVYSLARLRSKRPIGALDLCLGLAIDVCVLALQLNFAGGTSNPFVSLFMLPVILGAVVLGARQAWLIYGLTIACYLALAVADRLRPMPPMTGMDMAPGLIDRTALHMHGMMLGYAASAAVLVFMITRIRTNLMARDEELGALKAQALEQDHLLRLGLLTAGAAHELGTPLTTLSVIVKDWQDLGVPRGKAEREADLRTLSDQVRRCKSVISDVLAASGQMRGEATAPGPLRQSVGDICARWLERHPSASLATAIDLDDRPVAIDRIFEQAVVNVLDNAWEASQRTQSDRVGLTASIVEDRLVISIVDFGDGFAPDVLSRLGKPFVTTKVDDPQRPHGLGLFLSRNTARALSGDLTVASGPHGSEVRLDIPLATIEVGHGH